MPCSCAASPSRPTPGAAPEWEGLDPAEGTTTPEPTIEPGEGFTEESNLVTRDLLYDEHTNQAVYHRPDQRRQHLYIVIDYDKPTDEDAEQYETLLFQCGGRGRSSVRSGGVRDGTARVYLCGKVRGGGDQYGLPGICFHQYDRVRGGRSPSPNPWRSRSPTPEPEPEQAGGNTGTLLLILAVALVGGGAGWYFKVYRPKQQRAAETEEDYGDELETYDDTPPPWDRGGRGRNGGRQMKFTNSPYETMMQQVPPGMSGPSLSRPRKAPAATAAPTVGDRVHGLLPGTAERHWRREVKRWTES